MDPPKSIYTLGYSFRISEIYFNEEGSEESVCFSYSVDKLGIGDQVIIKFRERVYDYSSYHLIPPVFESMEDAIEAKEPDNKNTYEFDTSKLNEYRKEIHHIRQYREDSDFIIETNDEEAYFLGKLDDLKKLSDQYRDSLVDNSADIDEAFDRVIQQDLIKGTSGMNYRIEILTLEILCSTIGSPFI